MRKFAASKDTKTNKMLRDFMQTALEHIFLYDDYQDDAVIFEFDFERQGSGFKQTKPLFDAAVTFIGVSEGEMEIKINYQSYTVGKNSLVFVDPTHIIRFAGAEKRLKGWLIAISEPCSMETLLYSSQKKPVVVPHIRLKKNPIIKFDDDEYLSIHAGLNFVRSKMQQYSHLFLRETIIHALRLFFLEIGNAYFGKPENNTLPIVSRKEELYSEFRNLLMEHFKEEHEVGFYAGKLCITTQYLSLILKERSGMSAGRWIQETLITEAKERLKAPRANVQQVADELHFADQSVFGKFFKKHVGISPLAYRKKA